MHKKSIFFLLFLFPVLLQAFAISGKRAPFPPFVSGDGFRAACDYVFDETDQSLNPKEVAPNSTIFVKGDYLSEFFYRIHPQLCHPYILVTHNSDDPAPGKHFPFLEEEKLIVWFAQNADRVHPKLKAIPIGIANRYWPHGNGNLIKAIKNRKFHKTHLLYLNIAVGTYPSERKEVYRFLSQLPFTHQTPARSFGNYLKEIASSRFVASPRGNGLDTHRLWEALYLDSYPIVKSSSLDSLYEDLPVLIVQDWNRVTKELLQETFREFRGKQFCWEKLKIGYWVDLIDSYKKQKNLAKEGISRRDFE